MRVSAQLDLLQIHIGVDLMGRPQLVVTNNFGVGDLLPPGLPEQMLRLDGGVAQEALVGYHGHVVVGGHFVPSSESDLGVVHLYCRMLALQFFQMLLLRLWWFHTVSSGAMMLRRRSQSLSYFVSIWILRPFYGSIGAIGIVDTLAS